MPKPGRGRRSALIVLDMISEFTFEDAESILPSALKIAPLIARLRERAHRVKIPVIYVNDTAGRWESDPQAFIDRCAAESSPGHAVTRAIRPGAGDYFIFKPRHSAFFGTPLQTLLEQLRIDRLILTGITAHQCVLFTAMDAHVREFELSVPLDCVGAAKAEEVRHALFILERALKARVARKLQLS